jgi:thioredoxin:protein disulfide reductase
MMSSILHRLLLLFTLLTLTAGTAGAAVVNADQPFKAVGAVKGAPAEPGGGATLEITLHVLAGHYVYGKDTSVTVTEPAGLTVGKPALPDPHVKFDKWEDKEVGIYDENTVIPIQVTVPEGTKPGTYVVKADVSYRGCNPKMCFFPTTDSLEFAVKVRSDVSVRPDDAAGQEAAEVATGAEAEWSGWSDTSAPAETATESGSESELPAVAASPDGLQGKLAAALENAAKTSFLLVLLFAFLGGMITSLTPCVYPMIPITVAVIGARGTESTAKAFSLSLVYVLGIATLYSTLGLGAAAFEGVLGGVFNNPFVMIGIAIFFLLLAAGMFGFYNFALPSSLNTKLSQIGGQSYLGVFVIGLVGGVVISPCTGPVVGSALLLIASGEFAMWQGFLLMFSFSLGLGVLFLLIGTFSGAIQKLPQSGGWMSHVKNSFGFVMILAAVYFVGTTGYLPPTAMGVVYAVALVMWGVVLGVFTPMEPEAGWGPWSLRTVSVLLMMGGFLFLGNTFLGDRLGGGHGATVATESIEWRTDLDGAFADAEQSGKPLMLDFTAENCAQCRELEHKTFPDPEVIRLSRSFVALSVDCTQIDDREKEMIKRYGVPGMPRIVFTESSGAELGGTAIQGFVPPASFSRSMQAALDHVPGG